MPYTHCVHFNNVNTYCILLLWSLTNDCERTTHDQIMLCCCLSMPVWYRWVWTVSPPPSQAFLIHIRTLLVPHTYSYIASLWVLIELIYILWPTFGHLNEVIDMRKLCKSLRVHCEWGILSDTMWYTCDTLWYHGTRTTRLWAKYPRRWLSFSGGVWPSGRVRGRHWPVVHYPIGIYLTVWQYLSTR